MMGADGWDGRKRPINWKLAGGRKCRQMSTNCVKDVSFGADLARPPGGTCNTRIPFFKNKNSIKDGATVYKEINQWADGPVGELQAWGTRWRTSCCHGNGRWVPCCPNQKRKLLTASWRFSPSFCPRRWREIGKFQLCGPAHHAKLFGGEKKM